MTLLLDFCQLEQQTLLPDGQHELLIRLNPNHAIFKGHFPGNPVVPGVCMMQLIRELTQDILQEKLLFTAAPQVKFTALINPFVHPLLRIVLELSAAADVRGIKATVWFEDTVALKLNSTYRVLST